MENVVNFPNGISYCSDSKTFVIKKDNTAITLDREELAFIVVNGLSDISTAARVYAVQRAMLLIETSTMEDDDGEQVFNEFHSALSTCVYG